MTRRLWQVGALSALLVTVATSSPAAAQERGRGKFGLGVVLGSPTGLSMEFRLASSSALHVAVGLEGLNDEGRDDDFYVHVVWKFYLAELARTPDFSLPLYVGVGPYLANIGNDNIALGARGPVGIAFAFNSVPIDIFLEVALLLNVVEDVDVGVGAALGFHYFF